MIKSVKNTFPFQALEKNEQYMHYLVYKQDDRHVYVNSVSWVHIDTLALVMGLGCYLYSDNSQSTRLQCVCVFSYVFNAYLCLQPLPVQ